MVFRTRARTTTFLLLAVLAVALAGCSTPSVEFSVADAPYNLAQTQLILDRADASQFSERSVSEAVALRRKALGRLRGQGGEAAKAADFVTDALPPESASVPFYVEKADVDGVEAYIIVEAWGSRDGRLDRKRLWVFDAASGDVMFSAASQ